MTEVDVPPVTVGVSATEVQPAHPVCPGGWHCAREAVN